MAVALHALSQLLRSTGYTGGPSAAAPSPSGLLLSSLLAMLTTEHQATTRLELLRALGALGAPDPSMQMQMQLARQRSSASVVPHVPHAPQDDATQWMGAGVGADVRTGSTGAFDTRR